MIGRKILVSWLLFGTAIGCFSFLQVYVATEDLSRGAAVFGFGIALGVVGGLGRLAIEARRGGLIQDADGDRERWTPSRVVLSACLLALVFGAGLARVLRAPASVYIAILFVAAGTAALSHIYRRNVGPH